MVLETYKSLHEKQERFSGRYQIINSLSEFQNWYGEMTDKSQKKNKKMFRGLNEAKYKNYTSAQRKYILDDMQKSGVNLGSLIQLQIDALSGVKSAKKTGVYKNLLRRYYESLGVVPNDILYLSFAQHFNGISPLLDFSRNLNVALYFMTADLKIPSSGAIDIENYASIYYLPVKDYRQVIDDNSNLTDIVAQSSFEKLKKEAPVIITDKKVTIKNSKSNYVKGVVSFSNLNIILQEGGFVFYFNNDKSKELQPLEQELYCIDIHKSLTPYIKKEILKKKGISESYLFPKEEEMIAKSLEIALSESLIKI